MEQDSQLLKLIHAEVGKSLKLDKRHIAVGMTAKFIFYFLACCLTYGSLFVWQDKWLYIASYTGYGFAALLLAFNFAHDFSHHAVFKKKSWNNLGFIGIYTLVGAHAEAWRQRHIHSHHYAPNVEEYDSDLQISSLIRVIPGSDYQWYHRFQHWYAPFAYLTYSLYWIFIKDPVVLLSKDAYTPQKGWRYWLSFLAQKSFYLGYLLILPLLFSQQPWYLTVCAFLLMHASQSLFLLFTFFMTHHVEATAYPETDAKGYINTSWLMNQVRSSNDFYPFSVVANFIFGGFNNHIAHHLFPHVHHMHYPKLNRVLYHILDLHGIAPNQTTYWGGMVSHLRLLKKMSRK